MYSETYYFRYNKYDNLSSIVTDYETLNKNFSKKKLITMPIMVNVTVW